MEQRKFVQAGELILRQGAPVSQAYLIKSGKVELVCKDKDGAEIFRLVLGPEDTIGEMALLFGRKQCSTARAVEDAVLIVLSRRELQEALHRPGYMHERLKKLITTRSVVNLPLFGGLKPEERATIPPAQGPFLYAEKEFIYKEKEPIENLYIVCSGHVQEFREVAGREITTMLYKAGDFFCRASVFSQNHRHTAHARAISDTYIIKLPVGQFQEVMKKHDAVLVKMLECLAEYAATKQAEIEQRVTMTAPELLASFLRQLCDSHGLDPGGFDLPYKKSLIASRLGMGIETLSRAWPKLKDYGIDVQGVRISFIDDEKRASRAGSIR